MYKIKDIIEILNGISQGWCSDTVNYYIDEAIDKLKCMSTPICIEKNPPPLNESVILIIGDSKYIGHMRHEDGKNRFYSTGEIYPKYWMPTPE